VFHACLEPDLSGPPDQPAVKKKADAEEPCRQMNARELVNLAVEQNSSDTGDPLSPGALSGVEGEHPGRV
jgi:hypothetical protein